MNFNGISDKPQEWHDARKCDDFWHFFKKIWRPNSTTTRWHFVLREWYCQYLLKLCSWVQRKISSSDIFLSLTQYFGVKEWLTFPAQRFPMQYVCGAHCVKPCKNYSNKISTMEIRSRFTNANFVYGNLTSQREFMMPYLNSRSKFQYTMWKKKMVHYCCPMYTPSQINIS